MEIDDALDEFRPSAWDLASAINLEPDPAHDRPALDTLADAMLVWLSEDGVERLTDEVVDAVWSDDLADGIRDGLRTVGAWEGWGDEANAALDALASDGPASPIGRAVIQHLAMQLGHDDHPQLFCLCCIDEAIRKAPAPDRRRLALQTTILARRDVAVPDAELQEAFGAHRRADAAAVALATDRRREAVRARLRRIARLGASSIPDLAAELEAILAEPPPDPAADDVWLAFAGAALADVAQPELN